MAARLHHRRGAHTPEPVDRDDQRRVEALLAQHLLDDGKRGLVGMLRLVPATQQDGIAGFEAQRGNVDRDVGPGLIDHAEYADRNSHLVQAQAVEQR